jgi:hypothetical protein
MSTAVKRIMKILQNHSSLQVIFGGPKGDTAMDASVILFDSNMQEIISEEIQSYLDKEEKISLIANVLLDDGSVAWNSIIDVEELAEKILDKLEDNS